MTPNKVIAFCGSKKAGKSTSCNIFMQLSDHKCEELALADHLKSVCSDVFNLDIRNFMLQELKEKELDNNVVLSKDDLRSVITGFGVKDINDDLHIRPHIGKVLTTPRKLLQYIGTEVMHSIDPLIHVKKVIENKSKNKITIVTDLRFENEFNLLMSEFNANFIPVYVKNNQAESAAEMDSHASEREFVKFKNRCYTLDNNGSIRQLMSNIETLIRDVESIQFSTESTLKK